MSMLFFLLSIFWYLKVELYVAAVGMSSARSHGEPWEQENPSLVTNHSSLEPSHQLLAPGFWSLFYYLSFMAFILAMLGKGSAAVLPALILGIICWRRKLTKWDFLRIMPFFVVAAVLSLVNIWFQNRYVGEAIRDAGFLERILGAGVLVWFYLYKALFPRI